MKKYFNNIKNIEELKQQYKKLTMIHHPDRGGSVITMQKINLEYEKMFDILKKKANNSDNKRNHTSEMSEDFIKIINKLINLDGVIIEIVGSWIWLCGDTYSHKEQIKKLGFKWSKARKKWYLGKFYGGKHYKKKSFEELKNTYGYQKIDSKKVYQIA